MREQERGWGAVVAVWAAAATLALVALAVWWSTTLNSESVGDWDWESSGEVLGTALDCRMAGVPAGERPKLDQWEWEYGDLGDPPDRCPTEAESTAASQWRIDNLVRCDTASFEIRITTGAMVLLLEEAAAPGAMVGPADMEHYTRGTVALWNRELSDIEAYRGCEDHDEMMATAWDAHRQVLNLWYLCRHEWGDTIDCGPEPATPSE